MVQDEPRFEFPWELSSIQTVAVVASRLLLTLRVRCDELNFSQSSSNERFVDRAHF